MRSTLALSDPPEVVVAVVVTVVATAVVNVVSAAVVVVAEVVAVAETAPMRLRRSTTRPHSHRSPESNKYTLSVNADVLVDSLQSVPTKFGVISSHYSSSVRLLVCLDVCARTFCIPLSPRICLVSFTAAPCTMCPCSPISVLVPTSTDMTYEPRLCTVYYVLWLSIFSCVVYEV